MSKMGFVIFLRQDGEKRPLHIVCLRAPQGIKNWRVHRAILERVGKIERSGEFCLEETVDEGGINPLDLQQYPASRDLLPVIIIDERGNVFYNTTRDVEDEGMLTRYIHKQFEDGYLPATRELQRQSDEYWN